MNEAIAKPKAGKVDPRARRSRVALGDALFGLIEQKLLEDITIRELTERAGVGYATFFRHYETLNHLLTDIASVEVEEFSRFAVPILSGDHKLEAARQLCAYVDGKRRIWTTLLTRGGGTMLRQHFLERALEALNTSSLPPDDLPTSLRIHFCVRGTVDIIAWWLLREREFSREEVASFIKRLVIDPL